MGKKVSITVVEGPNQGLTLAFSEGEIVIGRAKGQIILSDKKISGRHCAIRIEGDRVTIEDFKSTNGTFIGSRKVEEILELENLDEVLVGLSRLSVAIVDELSDFKEQNMASGRVTSTTGPFDLDDLSAEDEDPHLDGLLEDSESSLFTKTKTGRNKSSEVQPREEVPEVSVKTNLPDPDAVYRETGIHRIDNLIKDELDTFSKWDHPAAEGTNQSASAVVPKITIELNPRRAPDGVGKILCTQAVTSFGRKEVDIRLNDLDVSRKHAAVEIVNGRKAFVRDLASTNGTFVNGKKVSYQELRKGDLLQIGQTIFEVEILGDGS